MRTEEFLELTSESIMNKLFCTFSPKESVEDTLRDINRE